MKNVYRVLALLVAAGVMVQAAAIAFGMFGLIKWIENGGTLDQSTELTPASVATPGFSVHATAGIMVLPAIALLFLISSFFAKVPGASSGRCSSSSPRWSRSPSGCSRTPLAGLGWLHGANALILFGLAVSAGMRVEPGRPVESRVPVSV